MSVALTKPEPKWESLFVYGSARWGEPNDWVWRASDGQLWNARVEGVLAQYYTHGYPVAGFSDIDDGPDTDGDQYVIGELMNIDVNDPHAKAFFSMERGAGYQMVSVTAQTLDGDWTGNVWAFHYPAWPIHMRRVIPSGDWIKHPAAHQYAPVHSDYPSMRSGVRAG